jgi:aminoglycoside 6'-N-acetyltransferase
VTRKDPSGSGVTRDILVDPRRHRRGYGSDAIRTLARHPFSDRSHRRLTIESGHDNSAIGCYASVGFRAVDVMRQ